MFFSKKLIRIFQSCKTPVFAISLALIGFFVSEDSMIASIKKSDDDQPTPICKSKYTKLKPKPNKELQQVIDKMAKVLCDFVESPPLELKQMNAKKQKQYFSRLMGVYKKHYEKNPEKFVSQVFLNGYFNGRKAIDPEDKTRSKRLAWFLSSVVHQNIIPFISQEIQIKVISPYLCSSDEKIAHDSFVWILNMTYNHDSSSPDLSHFKAYLKKHKNELPLKLVGLLYSEYPKESLLMMSELLQEKEDAKKLLEIINLKDKKESLGKLSERSEWWVQLYILNTIRKNKSFRSPEIIEQLENTKHALISKERIEFLKVKSKKRNLHKAAGIGVNCGDLIIKEKIKARK